MRLRATRLSTTGNNFKRASFLPEALEFFSRASVTDPLAQEDINTFILGCKDLGIWDDLIYVPCLPSHGGLHQLGGSAERTDTPWSVVNGSLLATGVSITVNNFANHLLASQATPTIPGQHTTYGVIGCQNHTPKTVIQNARLAARTIATWDDFGMLAAGAVPFWHNFSIGGQIVGPQQPLADEQVTNSYRNSHLVAVSSNGTTTATVLVDNRLTTATTPFNSSLGGTMRLYPPCQNGQNGWIQGAFFTRANMATLGQSVWGKFRALANQTMLSRLTSVGNRRILISGQSNGVNQNLSVEFSRQSVGELMGPTELFRSGVGGNPIATWVGAVGSNARTAQYRTDFWNSSGTGPPFQSTRLENIGRYQEYLIWFQGESDTESAAQSNAYRAQLATLIHWFREDSGNPSLKVIVVQIDYNFTLRDDNAGGFFSDLTLTGFSGGLSALNGSYAITTLTGHFDPYVWTKSGYRVEEQSNRWVFIETAGNTVVASAVQTNLPHPAMVTNWVDAASNPIAPSFGAGNRLEWIERVRYAQREIVNDLPNVFTFESRGYTRTDGVHIDNAAHISFATALGNYLRTI